MNTERIRKKRSSRNIAFNRAFGERPLIVLAAGRSMVIAISVATPVWEFNSGSTLVSLVQFRDQEQCQILPDWSSASRAGLTFDFKYQLHCLFHYVWISSEFLLGDPQLHL